MFYVYQPLHKNISNYQIYRLEWQPSLMWKNVEKDRFTDLSWMSGILKTDLTVAENRVVKDGRADKLSL